MVRLGTIKAKECVYVRVRVCVRDKKRGQKTSCVTTFTHRHIETYIHDLYIGNTSITLNPLCFVLLEVCARCALVYIHHTYIYIYITIYTSIYIYIYIYTYTIYIYIMSL